MHVIGLVTGSLAENCYLIWNNQTLLIIDPGDDPALIKEKITTTQAKPAAILLTHTHCDHIGAVDELRDYYHIPLYVSPLEAGWLQDPVLNLSLQFLGRPLTVKDAEYEFTLDNYTFDDLSFKVVPTPGHSSGSLSFVFENFVIAGDSLFNGSIGRTDLVTGNFEQLIHSIQTQLFTLGDDFIVYPGHGGQTTIGKEKKTNPFFN